MITTQITRVNCDDWEAIYINGKKVCEGHHVPLQDIFDYLDIEFEQLDVDEEWLGGKSNLPNKLQDVKINKE